MPRLFLVTSGGKIDHVELTSAAVVLGRAEDTDLSFPDDNGLSRRHLIFEERAGKWIVEDLGSKNGTLVNGTRITAPHELQPGERVVASEVAMTYQEPDDPQVSFTAPTPAPKATALTFLEDVLSREKEGEDGGINWILVKAGRELTQRRPLPELFGIILDLCLEAVPAERGVLLTLESSGGLVIQASHGEEIAISATVRDRVLSERASMLVQDVAKDEPIAYSASVQKQGVCSLLAIPLQSDERVVGMIYLDSLDPLRLFTHKDMNLLTALANIAGIRIELEQWELRRRQLISENVANLGRLTAALSHELATPLGALKSSLDTLWRTTQKGEVLDEAERSKLEKVQSVLRGALDASIERMHQVITRIQRFSNLDRAETRSVDVSELLEDVVALAQTPPNPVRIALECSELPHLVCHAQPLSSAMASLLAYSLEACKEANVTNLTLSAGATDTHIEIRIRYHGPGVPSETLALLFQPSFEIARQRVEAKNWRLFSALQVVRDQGGDIEAFSVPDEETGFSIKLPFDP